MKFNIERRKMTEALAATVFSNAVLRDFAEGHLESEFFLLKYHQKVISVFWDAIIAFFSMEMSN